MLKGGVGARLGGDKRWIKNGEHKMKRGGHGGRGEDKERMREYWRVLKTVVRRMEWERSGEEKK